jgi:hypothetical protein
MAFVVDVWVGLQKFLGIRQAGRQVVDPAEWWFGHCGA